MEGVSLGVSWLPAPNAREVRGSGVEVRFGVAERGVGCSDAGVVGNSSCKTLRSLPRSRQLAHPDFVCSHWAYLHTYVEAIMPPSLLNPILLSRKTNEREKKTKKSM